MRNYVLVEAVTAGVVILGPLLAGAGNAPPNPNKASHPPVPAAQAAVSPLRPDLIVEKMEVTGTLPDPSGGTKVQVAYTICNRTGVDSWRFPTPAGAKFWHDTPALYQQMYSSLDVRVLPGGAFPLLKGAECPIMLGANARWVCTGSVVVAAGKRVEIRATVDSLNYIDESDETNNTRTIVWPPVLPAVAVPR